jgi:hypothetical protein
MRLGSLYVKRPYLKSGGQPTFFVTLEDDWLSRAEFLTVWRVLCVAASGRWVGLDVVNHKDLVIR